MWPTKEEKLRRASTMPVRKLLDNLIYWTEMASHEDPKSDIWKHDQETIKIIYDEILRRNIGEEE